MAEEKPDQMVAPKMVRESDLIAVKEQLKKTKEFISQKEKELFQLKSELKVAKANLADDEGAEEVRTYLVKRDEELNDRELELNKFKDELSEREASFKGKEREARVNALASEYQVDIEKITDADDPEKEALRLKLERLTKEKETTPAEGTFEHAIAGGRIKKSALDMSDVEFKEYEKQLKAKANK
mgnify:CR=1 FL=1